jgi:hypothetical protein
MKKYENIYRVKCEHVIVKVTMNLKTSACSYRHLCLQTSCGNVEGNHPTPPTALTNPYITAAPNQLGTSQPTANHNMKTIQSLLLVAALALLFLVGKYAAIYKGLAKILRTGLPSIGLMKWDNLFRAVCWC